jgi:hypothetical protein
MARPIASKKTCRVRLRSGGSRSQRLALGEATAKKRGMRSAECGVNGEKSERQMTNGSFFLPAICLKPFAIPADT